MPARRVPQCTACRHRERAAIDLALARGVAVSALVRRYGISTDILYRHRKSHIPPQLKAKLLAGPDCDIDLSRLRESESQSLLANLVALRHRLFAALDVAEEAGDGFMFTRVSTQLHTNLELTGKLLGDLGLGSTTINNVLVMPAYIELRVSLTKALAPFPEARHAVAAVLHQLEGKAAADIAADKREFAGAAA
jgi:transposase-like protein